MKIRVPASSANLGCGFDSVGFAVNLYLEVEILEKTDSWEVNHDLGPDIPHDRSNLIVSTALKIFPELQPHRLQITSNIPLAHGLGSSSSALIAGIELACVLGDLRLTKASKLGYACDIEGHIDNVAPAVLGGLIIGSYFDNCLEYVEAEMPDVGLVAYIPDRRLLTSDLRKVLPIELSYKEAVAASSLSNVMIASLLKGDLIQAGRLMEQDLFHERYRSELIPELKEIRKIAHKYDAYATYLSGSGPTIMSLMPLERTAELVNILSKSKTAKVLSLAVDVQGAIIIK